jgi:hypothetical protein
MAYVPDWERLSDGVKRVVATGVAEDEAKSDVSRAIADRKIRVRLTVAVEADVLMTWHQMVAKAQGLGADPNHSAYSVECFEGASIKVPSHLTPDDFDWQNSRPLKPWQIRPHGGRLNEWRRLSRPPSLIELRTLEFLAWIQRTYDDARGGERASIKAHEKSTGSAGQETAAINALASQLRNNPDLKREDAATWCREQHYSLSDRGFRYRVWPKARADANLPTKGSPGRKRKSTR